MEDKFHQSYNEINYSRCDKISNSVSPIVHDDIKTKPATKDIDEIVTIYHQFIKNYNQINIEFELNNPIQIYTMFNCLLYDGYLSKDKEFQFSGAEARDKCSILGANIIMGKGVCRHISSTLKDILLDYGIEACNLGCYSKILTISVTKLKNQKYSYIELREWVKKNVIDERACRSLYDYIDELEKQKKYAKFSYSLEDEMNSVKKWIGNHIICYSRYNGQDYYLDPSQIRIYRLNHESKTLFDNQEDGDLEFRIIPTLYSNSLKELMKMSNKLLRPNPSLPIEEEQKLVMDTKLLYGQNADIFEQFYNDNHEIYNEISNRLVKIKKNKFATE